MESPESDENEDLSSGDESTEYSKIISIYNYADELLYSYKEPESEYSIYQVDSNEKVTAVFVQKANEENLYSLDTCVINTSGQVVLTYSFKNLPVKPAQILSEEYIIAGSYDGPINIYDRSGKLIMEDVELINHGLSVFSDQGYLVVNIYGYFSQNGVIYDSSLNKVTEGSLDSDGFMIPGMVYDVNGISCTAIETGDRWGFDGETPVVAVGKLNDRTAIRTDFGEFEIVSELGTYAYSNNHLVIMNENETYNLYNLKTGEFLGSLPDTVDFISVEDEYFLAETWDSETNSQTFRVIDKDGNIRLVTNGEYLACSNGEYIYMIRGPYHGIADLDGNWLMKSLKSEYSADKEIVIPVEN